MTNFINKANAMFCPQNWCRKDFKNIQGYEEHLPCDPPTKGTKRKTTLGGKTTQGGKSTRKRANLMEAEKRMDGATGTGAEIERGVLRLDKNETGIIKNKKTKATNKGRHNCVGANMN